MGRQNKGQITVEACMVVPLFLFFMMGLLEVIFILMAEAHIHQALGAATEYVAQRSYLEYKRKVNCSGQEEKKTEETREIDVEQLVDTALVWKQFQMHIESDFYVEKMVTGGKNGIVIYVKRDKANKKVMLVLAQYQVKAHLPLLGTYSISLSNQIKQKSFVGFSEEEYSNKESYVFITPNREAYHMHRDCTHLMLDVKQVSVKNKGNYSACFYCGSKLNGSYIYIAKNGEVYHGKRDCVGLKRSVRRVKRSSVKGLKACLRCGG